MKLLHIYGQVDEHSPVLIVGTSEALVALRDALSQAITDPQVRTNVAVMASDGEFYDVRVKVDESPWEGPVWLSRHLPYTDEEARGLETTMPIPFFDLAVNQLFRFAGAFTPNTGKPGAMFLKMDEDTAVEVEIPSLNPIGDEFEVSNTHPVWAGLPEWVEFL